MAGVQSSRTALGTLKLKHISLAWNSFSCCGLRSDFSVSHKVLGVKVNLGHHAVSLIVFWGQFACVACVWGELCFEALKPDSSVLCCCHITLFFCIHVEVTTLVFSVAYFLFSIHLWNSLHTWLFSLTEIMSGCNVLK